MNLVEVSVPKSAKPMCRGVSALALQLGRRETKVAARLVAEDLGRYKGKTLVCVATVAQGKNSGGDDIPVVLLQPTNKKLATHPLLSGTEARSSFLNCSRNLLSGT